MRDMEKNKRYIWYSQQTAFTEIKDSGGNSTGTYEYTYSDPVQIKLNVSAARGKTELDMFGVNVSYDKKIVTTNKNIGFDDVTRFWLDIVPTLETDGSLKVDVNGNPETPHDGALAAPPAISINSVTYAVKYVDAS